MFFNSIEPNMPIVRVARLDKFADSVCEALFGAPCASVLDLFERNIGHKVAVRAASRPGPIIIRVGPYNKQTQFVWGD